MVNVLQSILADVAAQLVLNVIVGILFVFGGGFLWEMARGVKEYHPRAAGAFWLLFVGSLVGLSTSLLHPGRILPPNPTPGVSLVIVPLAMALTMHGCGLLLRNTALEGSDFPTWYGGASFGLGAAIARWTMVSLLGH
jgi:hypothetical protein